MRVISSTFTTGSSVNALIAMQHKAHVASSTAFCRMKSAPYISGQRAAKT